ncbi:MAG: AAA family ATPase, partial [Actinomycetota bacterium]|nr:AAA family ATPase [Actinomycetota bacterium]
MKIAVVGKGGSGKTTTAAVLARTLARAGHPVVALDCDTNPNLGLSLGVGMDRTDALLT